MSYMTIQICPVATKKGVRYCFSDSGHNETELTSDYGDMTASELFYAIEDRMKAMMAAEMDENKSDVVYEMCYNHPQFSLKRIEKEFLKIKFVNRMVPAHKKS